uniref:Tyrosine-protein kinase receptor n=1 Tax=Sinonovacula constricta TaxID=98310 RepID=A0A3G5BC95_SINCO|nr:insulin-like peptide receptor [Sinonovacula constricta]
MSIDISLTTMPHRWCCSVLVVMLGSAILSCVSCANDFNPTLPLIRKTSERKPKVCGSMDIRNDPKNLAEKLTNCQVIEGPLKILLIDKGKPEDYRNLSFPDLVEITDFLLLYRVYGLKSLRDLFPNLAIIRGQNLFNDYALIVYEMPDMTELGLKSLTGILKGAVRLEKNPKLCFIETIDWHKLTQSVVMEDNYFKGNKDVKECVNWCPENCPRTLGFEQMVRRCWTISDCQKMLTCPENIPCSSGMCDGNHCCHSNCIGGCTGMLVTQCKVCRDVIQVDGKGNTVCAPRCSAGTYKYKNRRCLLDKECTEFSDYRLSIPLKLVVNNDISMPGECVDECPAGYKVSIKDNKTCELCVGKCPRVCDGKDVKSIHDAETLKGCTIVSGPLVIRITGGKHVTQVLEDNLSQLEEVTDFVQIHQSYPLLNLHFLPKLTMIRGRTLHKKRLALEVYDNSNLKELFLEEVAKNLTIENGAVSFQFNRKLCYEKIMDFVKKVGIKDRIETNDIPQENNGDQTQCNISELKFDVFRITPHIALCKWDTFRMADTRQLMGYTIHYKEAPVKNVTIFEGRDACTDEYWKTTFTPPLNSNASEVHQYIAGLDPWTQYAAYVQTNTISRAVSGAISKIIYFRTAANVPTSPINLKVRAINPGQLFVTWDPPEHPNGNVTHYKVYWQLIDFVPEEYELRDYCMQPLSTSQSYLEQKEEQEEANKNNVTLNGQCCKCPKSEKQIRTEERDHSIEIDFQDFLQNELYVKRLDRPATTLKSRTNRTRRDKVLDNPHEVNKYTYQEEPASNDPTVALTTSTPSPPNDAGGPTTQKGVATTPEPDLKENPFFKAFVYEIRELTIPNLGHFQDYNIEVIACQERDPRDHNREMYCSNRALGVGRTLPDPTADTINASTIMVTSVQNNTGAVRITWMDPEMPNGLILTYEIEYMKTNINNVKPIVICVTYKHYREVGKYGHELNKLDPGNYTFRLRATSLAGNGSWTEPQYFVILEITDQNLSKEVLIGIILAVVAFVVVIAILSVWFYAKRKFLVQQPILSANPDYYPDIVYQPDEWEVDREKVEFVRDLGQGSFGMVYEGLVKNLISGIEYMKVAVKTTNTISNDHDRYMFLQEASIMKAFKCHHVVKLMGVVSKGQPALVLMELMPNGDLKKFLRLHRPDEEQNNGRPPPTLKQILQMAGEIADGMSYLADKKYVHRDLAARNCMVAEDLTVKIGDFGMTRDIYETDYYRKGNRGLLPVRWMAPESLKDGIFTSMSDVWSYGVVLWEMATLAAQPYQGLSHEEVLRYVGSGKIMDTPERCPPKLYNLMVKCWRYRQKQRPTFKEIIEILLPDLNKNFQEVSYFFSEEAKQAAMVSNHNHQQDTIEDVDDDDDAHAPQNDYVDEAHLPMLGVGASNGHSVELQDIFTDSGSYPHFSTSRKHVDSAEVCDCTPYRAVDEGAAAQSTDFNRQSACSSPTSALGGSSDGSKDSSKSSNSSYAHMNGISVANGHVPVQMRTTSC